MHFDLFWGTALCCCPSEEEEPSNGYGYGLSFNSMCYRFGMDPRSWGKNAATIRLIEVYIRSQRLITHM